MSTQYIQLNQPLPAFPEPDTSLERVTKLEAKQYELIEVKNNYRGNDDDYACIKDPQFGNIWICIRSGKSTYATIVTSQHETEPTLNFDQDMFAIDESHLIQLLDSFKSFTYDLRNPTYPFDLNGINVPKAPPSYNNCCTFVEAIIVKAWQEALSGFHWNPKKHGQMMITSPNDYFSPVNCLVQSDIAIKVVDENAEPHPWTVVQGWRNQWSGGHTFIVLDYHKETDRVLTLESNKAFGLDGVGFRNIGNYRDINKPDSNWWQRTDLWTWSKFKSVYRFNERCVLKVKNVNWI